MNPAEHLYEQWKEKPTAELIRIRREAPHMPEHTSAIDAILSERDRADAERDREEAARRTPAAA